MTDLGWTGAVAIVTLLGAAAAFFKWALPFLRRVGHFLDDWFGEPERPGQTARPGVMERIGRVEHEVHTNNGSSMRDAVNRIEAALKQTAEEAAGLRESVAASADEQKAMWNAIEAIAKAQPPEDLK